MSTTKQAEWLLAPESKTFLYALGPNGTNAWWAQFYAVGPERVSPEELEAVVRLAKAAPKLLEALKLCAAVVSGQTMHKQGLVEALEAARGAISEATGEAA